MLRIRIDSGIFYRSVIYFNSKFYKNVFISFSVAACSSSNRMNASNVAIVWGPSLFAQNDTYDMIGRMNTLTKVLIENYDRIFDTNERLL